MFMHTRAFYTDFYEKKETKKFIVARREPNLFLYTCFRLLVITTAINRAVVSIARLSRSGNPALKIDSNSKQRKIIKIIKSISISHKNTHIILSLIHI